MIDLNHADTLKDKEFLSLVDLLNFRAGDRPNSLAYQFLVDGDAEGARLTYEQLYTGTIAISKCLLASAVFSWATKYAARLPPPVAAAPSNSATVSSNGGWKLCGPISNVNPRPPVA